MKKQLNNLHNILFRYAFLILIALPNLGFFYFVFTPLTIYPVYFILNLFFDASLLGNIILLNREIPIEFIDACIAGSAYYLLLILNLSTPGIDIKKRIKLILISFGALLILNVLRIFLLILIFIFGYAFFDITHLLFWYFLSIIFVVAVWFFQVRFFKIKEVPFYSDINFLYKNSLIKK